MGRQQSEEGTRIFNGKRYEFWGQPTRKKSEAKKVATKLRWEGQYVRVTYLDPFYVFWVRPMR